MSFVARWLSLSKNTEYEHGIKAFDRCLFEQAIHHFNRCLQETSDPATNRLARFYIGESYAQLGQAALISGALERGSEFLAKAIDIHPSYPDLHFQLAMAKRRMSLHAESLACVSKALNLNPSFAKAILLQGILWYESGRTVDGLKRMQCGAGQLFPDLMSQLPILTEGAEPQRIVEIFEAALAHDNETAAAQFSIGDSYYVNGDFHGALAEYEKLHTLSPEYPDLCCRMAMCHMSLGSPALAKENLFRALQLNPAYTEAEFLLAKCHMDEGDSRAAKERLRSVLAREPDNSQALDLLSQVA